MNGMDDLSLLQKRVLVFVKSFINNYGYPPTVREIAKGAKIKSTSTVHNSLNVLEEKGYITRDNGQSRSTVLSGITTENGVYSIPLLNSSGAGTDFGFIDVPKTLFEDREGVFAIKSKLAFFERGILEGDILIIKACDRAEIGECVCCTDETVSLYEEGMEITGKLIVCIRHF